jgi:hypothetical protein
MHIRPLLVTIFTAASIIGSVTFATTALSQGLGAAVDQSTRELLIGHDAMHNERVAMIDQGEVQLLLADQSSLSIAPGSDVVINEFVYDPKTQTGKLTATVTTGLLRYVGGGSSRKRDVVFYTPNGVVWLHSGIVLIEAGRHARPERSDGGRTEALLLAGDRMCVAASGQSQCTAQLATAISIERSEPPTAPTPVTTERIRGLFSDLHANDRVTQAWPRVSRVSGVRE